MSPRSPNVPRISLTKLAEYDVASPERRRGLLTDQKYPPTVQVASYTIALNEICDILIRGGRIADVDLSTHRLRSRTPRTDFERDQIRLALDALLAFRLILVNELIGDFSFTPGRQGAYLHIEGVDVSIRPDLFITGTGPGAAKIYLCKTIPLTKDEKGRPGSASYAGTLLHYWMESEAQNASPSDCIVVDVFAHAVYHAPKNYKRRRNSIIASCQEINARWPSIKRRNAEPGSGSTWNTGIL